MLKPDGGHIATRAGKYIPIIRRTAEKTNAPIAKPTSLLLLIPPPLKVIIS